MRLAAFNGSETSSSFVNATLHSGTEFASHVKVYPIYNAQGNVIATLTILTEIMSRQAASQSAVQSASSLDASALQVQEDQHSDLWV